MYKVLDKDTIKSAILPHSSVAKHGYVLKGNLVGVLSIHSLQVESIFSVAHNEEKEEGLFMFLMFLCQNGCKNMKDERFR